VVRSIHLASRQWQYNRGMITPIVFSNIKTARVQQLLQCKDGMACCANDGTVLQNEEPQRQAIFLHFCRFFSNFINWPRTLPKVNCQSSPNRLHPHRLNMATWAETNLNKVKYNVNTAQADDVHKSHSKSSKSRVQIRNWNN